MFLARAVAIVVAHCLGIFLRSMHSPQTYFTFEDTLTQIASGIPSCFYSASGRPLAVDRAGLDSVRYWLRGLSIR